MGKNSIAETTEQLLCDALHILQPLRSEQSWDYSWPVKRILWSTDIG